MIECFSRDTIKFFLETDTEYDLSGNQKKLFLPFSDLYFISFEYVQPW